MTFDPLHMTYMVAIIMHAGHWELCI